MTIRVHFRRVIKGYLVALLAVSAVATQATAAGPVQQAYFEPDYAASGFVVPAGMPAPEAYDPGVAQAGFFGRPLLGDRLGGGYSACDGCQGACGPGGCGMASGGMAGAGCGCQDGGCGLLGGGCGLLGGCGSGGCLAGMRPICLFCGNSGCGICQSFGRGYLLGALQALRPYGAAGIATQRWYDLSVDVMILETSSGASGQVFTTRGVDGTPVLRASDAQDDFTAGGRISGALICGPGGNIEVTYLGGNRWSDEAVATGNGDLYSFLSDFGLLSSNSSGTPAGFDDTDRSNRQSVGADSTFHSGEVNYRRRTVGPYGRFQWSGLGGIRYLRFDSDFEYDARGNDGFFNLANSLDNEMVGAQLGGDLWWNVVPGINLGIALKGGPMGNRMSRRSVASSNSLGPLATPGQVSYRDHESETVWLSELEATLLYRISHSWTLKSQYYLLHVDEVGYGYDTSLAENVFATAPEPIGAIDTRSLTIRGFSFGLEYIW